MSIFRESFPEFIQNELDRRQNGILARTPQFVHQLNTRSAWIRMTSGVNTVDENGTASNLLAKRYVLQGGVLNRVATVIDPDTQETSDAFTSKKNIGKSFSNNTYSNVNASGNPYRLGIRPMPGITGVSIKNKGAYGSLQEATVSFVAWDIRQLEELELLYMRPGYTVLLEFGWDYVKPTPPQYDILNKSDISLNKAFSEIYNLIIDSKGNYDALLGYVTNYNWSARDDGGYDCTTTIISLGEVLESLKVNWVPVNTYAFDKNGLGLLKQYLPFKNSEIFTSYEQGIIPGLLHELWDYLDEQNLPNTAGKTFTDTTFGTTYYLYINENSNTLAQNDRGGYPKPLGKDIRTEAYISLGSFCDLLNNYVLLKDKNDNPISQVTAYETDVNGNVITEIKEIISKDKAIPKNPRDFVNISRNNNQNNPPIIGPRTTADIPSSLKCIASPFAISTNLGVCLVRNDNWATLKLQDEKSAEEQEIEETTTPPAKTVANDVKLAIKTKTFGKRNPNAGGGNTGFAGNVYKRIQDKIIEGPPFITGVGESVNAYVYSGENGLKNDIEALAQEFLEAIVNVDVVTKDGKQIITLIFEDGSSFIPSTFGDNIKTINFFEYFYTKSPYNSFTLEEKIEQAYKDIFTGDKSPVENGNLFYDTTQPKPWTRAGIKSLLSSAFTKVELNNFINEQLTKELPEVATAIADAASRAPGISSDINEFLVPTTSNKLKTIGNISNIYVNMNFLYSQAISKNVAANDTQNKSVISIREYLQGILREVQNSLGNINDFDIQVDSRNAIGRIIDINYTGDPSQDPFLLQIHNLNSVVRNYSFQSKIFPEMGAIIAISAQDPGAIGRLGYDNATLVAWNEGVEDRLISKRDFTSLIKLDDGNDPVTFIYPFLTKMYKYFQSLQGSASNNSNFAYGGLNFAYRDFLAYLSNIDKRNNFKGIIPTELSVTLDGIGGIVIGNLFTINQDIVPKGYQGIKERKLAYIITKIGHDLQNNDWTTTLSAYPIIFEYQLGVDVSKGWNNQEYPGANPGSIKVSVNGVPIINIPNRFVPATTRIASFGEVSKQIPISARPLLDTIAYAEGTAGKGQNGYDVLVGFGQIPAWTPDYISGHPNVAIYIESINNSSTAAGRYQFLNKTWNGLGLKEFNKENQDKGGWQLIKNNKFTAYDATQALLIAKQQIASNNIAVTSNPYFLDFLNKTYRIWASLPNGSGQFGYKGQGGKYTPEDIYKVYVEAVKKY